MVKNRTLYILNWGFSFGTASSNRLVAYANSAAAEGLNVIIIVLLSLDLKDYQPNNRIMIRGLFPCYVHNKFLSRFLSFFTTIWFLLTEVHKDDCIILYGSSEYLPLCVLLKRKRTWFEVTECPDLFPPKTYSFGLYKLLWEKVAGIFVISSNLKQYFIDHGIPPERVHIINMIVDPTRFSGITRDKKEGHYIAYCGNVVQDSKDGVEDLLHAFVEYRKSYPDRRLFIIGQILSQSVKNHYFKYIMSEGIEDSVIFTGSVSPKDIPQYFVNAEMLVLARPDTIQAKYGFPTKVGEYLLSGRPCVLTNVGNITDFLTDGKDAFIAEAGNIQSIAYKMKEVSANALYAEDVGLHGKAVALKEFNSKIEVQKIINIITS